jgi:hypothetical protein
VPIVTNGLETYWNASNNYIQFTNLGQIDFDSGISNYTQGQTYTFTVSSYSRTTFDAAGVKPGDYITNDGVVATIFAIIEAVNGYSLTIRAQMNWTDNTPAQWSGESIIRNTWTNISPNTPGKHLMIINGATASSSDVIGTYIPFNGSVFGRISDIQFTGNYTFEALIKPSSSGLDILSDLNKSGFFLSGGNGFSYELNGQTSNIGQPYTGNNVYAHVAWTVDITTKKVSVYLNGAYVNFLTMSSIWDFSTTRTWLIGDEAVSGTTNAFKGNIYALRIYNRVLTDSEITQNYAIGTAVGLPNYYVTNLSDSISVTDSLTNKQCTNYKSISDSVNITDSLSKKFVGFKTLSDTITTTDFLTKKTAVYKKAISDSVTISDLNINKKGSYNKLLSDSIVISEGLSKGFLGFKTVTDSISITDSLTQQFTGNTSLSDTVTLSDYISKKYTVNKSLSDSILTTDSLTSSSAIGTTYTKFLTDSIVVADTLTKKIIGFKNLSDTIAISDSITNKKQSYNLTLLDTVTITDSLTKKFNGFKVLSDSIAIIDTAIFQLLKQNSYSVTLSDAITIIDSISANLIQTTNKIYLNGNRNLSIRLDGNHNPKVYLQGSRILIINLKGDV